MSEMIERVARAICRPIYEKMFAGRPPELIAAYVEVNWRNHIDQARAAIEAWREPTPRVSTAVMAAAGRSAEIFGGEIYIRGNAGETIVGAMIDAALSPTPTGDAHDSR